MLRWNVWPQLPLPLRQPTFDHEVIPKASLLISVRRCTFGLVESCAQPIALKHLRFYSSSPLNTSSPRRMQLISQIKTLLYCVF